jgi:translation initiation factor 2 alpha subunit (eIF-2alpha)
VKFAVLNGKPVLLQILTVDSLKEKMNVSLKEVNAIFDFESNKLV